MAKCQRLPGPLPHGRPLPSPSLDGTSKPRLTSLSLHKLRIHQHDTIYTKRENGERGGGERAQRPFR